MKKIVLIALATIAVALLVTAAVVPLVVPPKVERLVRDKLSELGIPAEADLKLGYRWSSGPSLVGSLDVSVLNSCWRVRSDFSLSLGGVSASVRLPETAFSQDDPVLKMFLEQHPLEGVSDLKFSGTVSLDAEARASLLRPTPRWNVRLPLRNLSASAVRNDNPVVLDSLSLTASASGISEHCDLAPLHIRAKSLAVGDIELANLRANLIASEKSLLLTDATSDFCGGTVSVYALRLNLESLNTGLTFLLDDVDAGEVLSRLQGFSGSASGRLHGKVRLFLRKGGESLRLREAFLYSVPGETGNIRLRNPEEFSGNLALVGLDDQTRTNLSSALTDLSYSVLRFDLTRGEGNDATLTTRVAGNATVRGQSVPVDVTVNLHGELEQLVNLGLEYSSKLKGNDK